MKIGILGAGLVGQAVAVALSELGHEIRISASNPESRGLASIKEKLGDEVVLPGNQAVADFAELLFLATPWLGTRDILGEIEGLKGKIVLDATNPIRADFSGLDESVRSGGETVAKWADGAIVVKTLNHIAAEMMHNPQLESGQPIMFVAGDDEPAKLIVMDLLTEMGFAAEDAGALEMSRHMESFAWLYINRAVLQGKGRDFAFTISKATSPV